MTKVESIISDAKDIHLENAAGKIQIEKSTDGKSTLSYIKKEWKEWCQLHHKEEDGKLSIKTENTSFTGEGGCLLHWTLKLNEDSQLRIDQAAGQVSGNGNLKSLNLNLAAGDFTWENATMPITAKVAAGRIKLENFSFPAEGTSTLSSGAGDISVTSPEGSPVSTTIQKAIGMSKNDFSDENKSHKLSIQVAVGKASHTKI